MRCISVSIICSYLPIILTIFFFHHLACGLLETGCFSISKEFLVTTTGHGFRCSASFQCSVFVLIVTLAVGYKRHYRRFIDSTTQSGAQISYRKVIMIIQVRGLTLIRAAEGQSFNCFDITCREWFDRCYMLFQQLPIIMILHVCTVTSEQRFILKFQETLQNNKRSRSFSGTIDTSLLPYNVAPFK